MTKHGELANHLMHPKHEVAKVYLAKIEGKLTGEEIKQLENGVLLDGKKTAPAKVRLRRNHNSRGKIKQLVQLTIHEGHYHQVKRMLQAVGHRVEKLSRPRYAFLDLHGLTAGDYRELTRQEIDRLRHA